MSRKYVINKDLKYINLLQQYNSRLPMKLIDFIIKSTPTLLFCRHIINVFREYEKCTDVVVAMIQNPCKIHYFKIVINKEDYSEL